MSPFSLQPWQIKVLETIVLCTLIRIKYAHYQHDLDVISSSIIFLWHGISSKFMTQFSNCIFLWHGIAALLSDYSLNCYSFQVHFILQSFLINHKFIYATLSICFCHYLHFHVKHILCRFRLSCIQSRRNLPWRLYWRYYCIDDHICLFCAFPEAFNVFPSIAYQKRKKKNWWSYLF